MRVGETRQTAQKFHLGVGREGRNDDIEKGFPHNLSKFNASIGEGRLYYSTRIVLYPRSASEPPEKRVCLSLLPSVIVIKFSSKLSHVI